ncbi:hypothetical protein BGW80DRAFT_1288680 [Lactifluus volemus]|nr:hypothetical protein BGW80DRAFT_1288680 [Lactifluus volemus]
MQVGSPVPADDLDIASMDTSPSARLFSLDLPSRVKRYMEQHSRSKDYTVLHAYIDGLHLDNDAPQNIVSLDVFKQNVTRKNSSDFRNLVNKAVTEKDWENVITHDVFWTELPADPLSHFDFDSSRQLQRSWTSTFACREVVERLEEHVRNQIKAPHLHARYCSIIQSSGMGKSCLLDEFSKLHFVIPVNLRASTSGYPPPDVAVRDFLTPFNNRYEDEHWQETSYSRASHFLFSLFIHTKDVVVRFGAEEKKDCVKRFREFMSKGQRFGHVGYNRWKFYNDVVTRAKMDFDDKAITTPDRQKLQDAFEELRECICIQEPSRKSTTVDVFIMFDEAHSLTTLWPNCGGLSNFTELQRALTIFSWSSLFTFFLSTTGKISQSMPPAYQTPRQPRAFIELGFDQLMTDRRIPDRYPTLEAVTSLECISHMGRPLWGTMYDHGDISVHNKILLFAIQKLLGSNEGVARSEAQEYAILSQRLALDINSAAYVSVPSTSIREKTLDQIANHMQVCVEIGEENENIRGIAASEPILSEAASIIMRNTDFQWLNTLRTIVPAFSVNVGDRGELLVAAFLTQARDMAISLKPSLPPPECCSHFLVKDLFKSLFFEKTFKSMFQSIPSICLSTSKKLRFKKVAAVAHMHFNHFIKAQEQKVTSHQYLLGFIARGAAVLGANGQPGFDAVLPYLFETTNLDISKLGFIIIRVENDGNNSEPDADMFLKMDPFTCGLLDKLDVDGCFRIPIIRIVFSLRGEGAVVTPMRYSTPSEGASLDNFDERGEPRFVAYDFWCSGIGPDLLQPVGNAHAQWAGLLKPGGPWRSFYDSSPAPDELRSQFPMGSCEESHWKRWLRVVKEREI